MNATLTQQQSHGGPIMDRLPPFSEEAERAVLGCVLLAPEDVGQMLAKIQRSDFYDLRHKEIFSACACLHADGKPPQPLLVAQWLKDKNKLDGVGGMAYVSNLPDEGPPACAFDFYLEVLKEKAARRAALALSVRIGQLALDEKVDPHRLIHDARHYCSNVFKEVEPRQWFRFYAPSECRNYDPPQGLVLAGDCHITRGAVTVIAGPPGVGKSRAALALAVCGASGQPWFGLPMQRRFRTAILQNENGLHRLKKEFAELTTENLDDFLRVTDPPPFGMAFDNDDFRARLADWLEEWKPDVVVFDPWNSAARDDGQRDYLTLLKALKEALPKGDIAPALVIVAHTRKPRAEERKSGRGLLNDVAGSHVLVSVPRCVFVMQHASPNPEDDRVVWTCCKNNDGPAGARTAWHRRNGLFAPCEEFDWEAFDDSGSDACRSIQKTDLEKLFEGGRRRLLRKHAASELEELTGWGKSSCYAALSKDGRFAEHLREDAEGLLSWHP